MVPHSRHRGIQQSADILHNRSTPLKLEKKILITIIFTIMSTTCRQRRCGCRRWCPQPRIDCLRRFWCISSVLWTYCHCPVARFLWRQLGRQSKYGRRGGDLGWSTTVDLVLSMCAFPPLAEFGNATAGRMPSCVLSLRGAGVEGSRGTRGIKKVSRLIAKLGSWGWPQTNDVPFLMAHILAKKYGHHTTLRWCHTNLGSLYMMVPSDWRGNFV